MNSGAVNATRTGVVIDVTSVISAEEYIVASNERRPADDPFARQAFVELTQSVIFQPLIYVVHPLSERPSISDFGQHPRLLQAMFETGLAQPFVTGRQSDVLAADARDLGSRLQIAGIRPLLAFIDKTAEIDANSRAPMMDRYRAWTRYQRSVVQPDTASHLARIPTGDGIEEDAVGDWVRSVARSATGELARLTAGGAEDLMLATLVRGLRYHGRIQEAGLLYQAHPLRRDFLLYFNVAHGDSSHDVAGRLLEEVRGVHGAIKSAAGVRHGSRFELAEMVTPLLGGRLWKDGEVGKLERERWIESVVGRLAEYRARAQDLRIAVASCSEDGRLVASEEGLAGGNVPTHERFRDTARTKKRTRE